MKFMIEKQQEQRHQELKKKRENNIPNEKIKNLSWIN